MGDVREWDEDGYRESIHREMQSLSLTVFRTAFPPSSSHANSQEPDLVAAALSDGSIATYSISKSTAERGPNWTSSNQPQREFLDSSPCCWIKAHEGPTYDIKFYDDDSAEHSLLLSCGDDGKILGWKWKDILNFPSTKQGKQISPLLELVNTQHKGPWGALSPIPETNAIAADVHNRRLYSAAGDSCAYCWDLETCKRTMTFKGHSDYLHSVLVRKSNNQIITGSEDGTARLWDCRSGKCVRVLDPSKSLSLMKDCKSSSWISCLAIDASESWLVCGGGAGLSLWSLPASECILKFDTHRPVQDAVFDGNTVLAVGAESSLTRFKIDGKILSRMQCAPRSIFSVCRHPSGVVAVGGYGGLVDIISTFGSHLCTFRCQSI